MSTGTRSYLGDFERFVKKRYPDVIREYQDVMSDQPRETDVSRIKEFYALFVRESRIRPFTELNKWERTDHRNLFMAVVMYLYKPSMLRCGFTSFLPVGTQIQVVQVLEITHSNVNKRTSNAIFLYKQYADFREKVHRIAESIIK